MTNQPLNEAEATAIISQALLDARDIELVITPFYALTLIGLLQLALRHPVLPPDIRHIGTQTARQLQQAVALATGSFQISHLIESGFDPAHDYAPTTAGAPTVDGDADGNPITPGQTKVKIDLVRLIQQALPQVHDSDKRGLLFTFLLRTKGPLGIETPRIIVEIDLPYVILPDQADPQSK